ncbi:MAG: winged helix-turn-helix domain-containing protein [Aliidiomarina sp.]|uniref:winged helix-turn-helix domain-containing protein n=1 Tax=Aliidiomarina sp. TaxID=1872439 RepID=UPI0025BA73F2|nr:winged helix-turn-helix domain-containing protein [Aliidiomarina sp.]MCH8501170.1 winged helix-turn-helix domain-containing protein [Aliidiomarina sp.]
MTRIDDSESSSNLQQYQIADVVVDPLQLEICTTEGECIALQKRPIEVLCYLIEAHPRLVTREELIENIWDGNAYVGEKALTNVIWQLRSSFEKLGLCDCIQTVRKRGYRLAAEPFALNVDSVTSLGNGLVSASSPIKNRILKFVLAPIALLIFVVAIGLGLLPERTNKIEGADLASVEIVTTGVGRAQFASISPDGQQLVYAMRPFSGESNLYLHDLRNPYEKYQLTFSPHRETRPVWSRTGRHVVFPREEQGSGRCAFYAVDVITREEQRLSGCRRSGTSYITAHPLNDEFYFSGLTSNNSNLYRMTWDGGDARVELLPCVQNCEFSVRDVSISPDGRYLALTRRAHRFSEDLYIRDLATHEEFRLTDDQVDIIGISWHPDGQHVVMATTVSSERIGYLVNIQSGERQKLPFDNFGSPSQISADGSIYFHTIDSQVQLSYFQLTPDLPSTVFPLTASSYQHRDPHFNAVTGQFAFVSNRSGAYELWIADENLMNPRKLTAINNMVRFPRWSHDGRHIAFVARYPSEQTDVLSLLTVATGRVERLYEFERVLGRPTWWYDGSALIVREGGELHVLDLDTRELRPLTTQGGIFAQSLPSGDIYFTRGTNRGLWRLREGDEAVQVISNEEFGTRYSWVVTDHGIYFYQLSDSEDRLVFYNFADETVRNLIAVPPELVTRQSTFTYDGNNQRLVIESWQARSNIMRGRHALLSP